MSDLEARVDSALSSAIAERRIVGGVFLVAQRGEVVCHRAVGLADREAGRVVEETTAHRLLDRESETSAVLLTNTTFEGMSGQVRTDLIRAVHAS